MKSRKSQSNEARISTLEEELGLLRKIVEKFLADESDPNIVRVPENDWEWSSFLHTVAWRSGHDYALLVRLRNSEVSIKGGYESHLGADKGAIYHRIADALREHFDRIERSGEEGKERAKIWEIVQKAMQSAIEGVPGDRLSSQQKRAWSDATRVACFHLAGGYRGEPKNVIESFDPLCFPWDSVSLGPKTRERFSQALEMVKVSVGR